MSQSQSPPGYSRPALIILTICTMLATLVQALDSTIANVALPYMQGSMSASQDEINWVLTSYIISCAIMTAPTSFMVSRFGRTRVFVLSIAGFTIASVLCGLAQSVGQIVLFRLLQGACGGALVPLSQTVLLELYPGAKRGAALAMWGIGVQVGPVAGPILGGWLTQELSWRWVFYVNVPLGIFATVGMLLFLKETPVVRAIRMDWVGFLALSLGVGALQLLLDRGELVDWFSAPEIVTEACLAGIGFYLFAVQTALAPKPFLSPRLFADVNFAVGTVMVFLVGLVQYATLALLSPYLQNLSGDPVITTGMLLGPRGLGTMAAMLLAGRLINRVDVRYFIGFGSVLGVFVLWRFTRWTPDVSASEVVWLGVVQGFSVGLVFMPLSTVIYATLPLELRVEAAGVFSLIRNLGSAIGISVTGALLTFNTQVNHAIIAAVVTPFNHALQLGRTGALWNPAHASGAAALDAVITRQAQIIAYGNDFKLMLILSVLILPSVLMLRPVRAVVVPAPPRRAAV